MTNLFKPTSPESALNNLRASAAYLDKSSAISLEKAWHDAYHYHEGQKRASGDAYIVHPTEVALMLSEMRMDLDTLRAALLHDVLEDTACNAQDLKSKVGTEVTQIVQSLSKLKSGNLPRDHVDAETFRRFALALQGDIRVGIIKICDRLHNIRTLDALELQKQQRIARQTLALYAPLALRMGLNRQRIELEETCLQVLHPIRYKLLEHALKRTHTQRTRLFNVIVKQLEEGLQPLAINASYYRDEYHVNAFHTRLLRDSIKADIGDKEPRMMRDSILGRLRLQIVVNNINECYQALGQLHNLYHPLPGSFGDHIASPRENGYQALSTTVIAPGGSKVATHIRTRDMHERAQHGIAWYWLHDQSVAAQKTAWPWLKKWADLSDITEDPKEFLQGATDDLVPQKLQAYSPTGELYLLPMGATALDFAYAVHADLGNQASTCLVNHHAAPLNQILRSGDMVQIIKSRKVAVQLYWLDFVTTPKARYNIKHYLKNLTQRDAIRLGKRMLMQALTTLGSSLRNIRKPQREQLCALLETENFDSVLEEIGIGNRHALLTARQLTQKVLSPQFTILEIKGSEGLSTQFASCCLPVPGDPIEGVMHPGIGLDVHHENCNLRNRKYAETVPLSWCETIDRKFETCIVVIAQEKTSALATLSNTLADADIYISGIQYNMQSFADAELHFKIHVSDLNHLERAMTLLRNSKLVHSVRRYFKEKHS